MIRLPSAIAPTLALLAASPAIAQVTAADVWQNSNVMYEAMGGTFAADITATGALTTYRNHEVVLPLPLSSGDVTVGLPDFDLTENGDGTVAMTFPNGFNMGMAIVLTGLGSLELGLTGEVGDFVLTASGAPGDITYTSGDSALTLSLSEFIVDGVPQADFSGATPPDFALSIDIIAQGATSEMRIIETADSVTLTNVSTAEASVISYEYDIVGLEDAAVNTILNDSGGSFELVLPKGGIDVMNLSDALRRGLAVSFASASASSSTTAITRDTLGLVISDQTTMQGPTDLTFTLDAAGLGMVGAAEAFSIVATENFLPVPIEMKLADATIDWHFPLLASPDAQEARLNTMLAGLEIGEDMWALFDPAGSLDREPITMGGVFTAQANIDVDLVDAELFLSLRTGMPIPVEVSSFSVTGAVAEALGARVTADADIALDYGPEPFFGQPRPSGEVSFTATGINAAVAALIDAGLVTANDTMPLLFGLNVIGVPVGDDAYEGTIEMRVDGQVFANGQPLQ